MSTNRKPVAKPAVETLVVRGFDAEKLKAPFLLRCGALTIDYIVVLLVPVVSLLLGRFLQYDGAKLLNSEINNTGWLIAFLVCLTNFIIFPMFSGQTIGKMITGLRLVRTNGTDPGFGTILLRHLIGYPLTLGSAMLGFLLSVLNKRGMALHDYIAGTVVVYGKPVRNVAAKKARKKARRRTKAQEEIAT